MDGPRSRGVFGRVVGKVEAILRREAGRVGRGRETEDSGDNPPVAVGNVPESAATADEQGRLCHLRDGHLTQAAACLPCEHLACEPCPGTASARRQQDSSGGESTQQHRDSSGPDPAPFDEAVSAARNTAAPSGHGAHRQEESRDANARYSPMVQLRVVMRVPSPPTRPTAAPDHPDDRLTLEDAARQVNRVYRKPRQRIRYTCHTCQTSFSGASACTNCGHSLCGFCTRQPPRRSTVELDPVAVQAVAQRLAAMEVRWYCVQREA